MIASVARESGRSVESVGADSYALTLWAYLHGKDAERLLEIAAELERIELAEMVTRGFHGKDPMKEINRFRDQWRAKLGGVRDLTVDDVRRAAEELEERHAAGVAKLSDTVS